MKKTFFASLLGAASIATASVAGLLPSVASAQDATPLKIGVIVAQSGAVAIYGEPVPKALRLLVDQLPQQQMAGHPVQLIVVDSESNSTKAVQLARRLIDRDEVHVVIGPSTSGEAIPLVPIFNQSKVPNLTFGSAEPVTSPVTPYVFGVAPYDRLGIVDILENLKKRSITKIALVHSQDGFGQGGLGIFKETAPKYGIELAVIESFAPQDTDMTPQLLRVREAKGVGAVVAWAPTPGPTILLRNADALKLNVPFYVGFAQASHVFREQVGKAGEGVYVSSTPIIAPEMMPTSDQRRTQMVELARKYKETYGATADQTVGHALDSFLIIKNAMESLKGPLTRTSLRDAIETVNFCGANGCRAYKPDDHRGLKSSGLVMLQIKDGQFRSADAP